MKFYTVYKTVNKENGKCYIGKHITDNPYDGYLGSGKYLKRAIKKYGIESFEKFVLFIFDNEMDMNNKEKELVNEEYLKENTYNLKTGGTGGWDYVNRENKNIYIGHSEISKKNIKKATIKLKELLLKDKMFYDRWCKNISLRLVGNKNFKGKKHTEETKRKLSEKQKSIDRFGAKNPMYGKKRSEETKRKISESVKKTLSKNKQITVTKR